MCHGDRPALYNSTSFIKYTLFNRYPLAVMESISKMLETSSIDHICNYLTSKVKPYHGKLSAFCVGGINIAHNSHTDKPYAFMTINLLHWITNREYTEVV